MTTLTAEQTQAIAETVTRMHLPEGIGTAEAACSIAARVAQSLTATADGCFVWTKACNRRGYGVVRVGGKYGRTMLVHRVVWVLANGPIPDGQHVLHRCDNPPCCNTAHLFLGTDADNIADMKAKGRAAGRQLGSLNGDRHHLAKLSSEAVREIRALHAEGAMSQHALARRFGVSRGSICGVIYGRTWRTVR